MLDIQTHTWKVLPQCFEMLTVRTADNCDSADRLKDECVLAEILLGAAVLSSKSEHRPCTNKATAV